MKPAILLVAATLGLGLVAVWCLGRSTVPHVEPALAHAAPGAAAPLEAGLSDAGQAQDQTADARSSVAAHGSTAPANPGPAAPAAPVLALSDAASTDAEPAAPRDPAELGIGEAGPADASIDSARPVDRDGFADKYKDQSVETLKATLETVEAILRQQDELQDKSLVLDSQQLQALQREREWLKTNAFP